MHRDTKTPGSQWNSALAAAVESSGAPPGALTLFHEEREDLVVVVGGEGAPTARQTGWCGVSATGADGEPLLHRSDPDPDDLRTIARNAVTGDTRWGLRRDNDRPDTQTRIGNLDMAGAIRAVGDARRLTHARRPDASFRARCVVSEQQIRVATPAGRVAQDLRRGFRLELEVQIARRGRRAIATADSARPLDERQLRELVDELLERAERRLGAEPLPTGNYSVALAPGVGGVVAHEIVGHALEADTVAAGESWLANAEEPVADPRLVVLDDPRRARAAWRIDDEGTPASVTALVQGGSVCGRLHDLRSAARLAERPTGHGRRSTYRDPVLPRMGCTFIAPGPTDPLQLLADVGDGLYVRRMVAASVDTRSGRAVFRVAEADRLENGEARTPLRPFLLVVDGASSLRQIRCANDLVFDVSIGSCHRAGQTLVTSVGAPTMCLGVNGAVS